MTRLSRDKGLRSERAILAACRELGISDERMRDRSLADAAVVAGTGGRCDRIAAGLLIGTENGASPRVVISESGIPS
jgi:hypothetical protein